MTDAHRLHTLALLTGGQKQAVENCNLVPKIIFAHENPEKQMSKYSFRRIRSLLSSMWAHTRHCTWYTTIHTVQ